MALHELLALLLRPCVVPVSLTSELGNVARRIGRQSALGVVLNCPFEQAPQNLYADVRRLRKQSLAIAQDLHVLRCQPQQGEVSKDESRTWSRRFVEHSF